MEVPSSGNCPPRTKLRLRETVRQTRGLALPTSQRGRPSSPTGSTSPALRPADTTTLAPAGLAPDPPTGTHCAGAELAHAPRTRRRGPRPLPSVAPPPAPAGRSGSRGSVTWSIESKQRGAAGGQARRRRPQRRHLSGSSSGLPAEPWSRPLSCPPRRLLYGRVSVFPSCGRFPAHLALAPVFPGAPQAPLGDCGGRGRAGCVWGAAVPRAGRLATARGEACCCRAYFLRRRARQTTCNLALSAGNQSRGLAGKWTVAPGGSIFRVRQSTRVEARRE